MEQNNPLTNLNPEPTPSLEQINETDNPVATQQRPQPNQQKVTKLKLVTKTWNKDSYGLFDYQIGDESYDKKIDFIEETVFIVRDNKTCRTLLLKDLDQISELQKKEESMKIYFKCSGAKQSFTVLGQLIVDKQRKSPSFKLKPYKKPSQLESTNQSRPLSKHSNHSKKFIPFVFAEATQPKSHGCLLFPGSIIKFGRVQYLILESFNGKETKSYCESIYYDDQEQNIFDVLKQKTAVKEVLNVQDKDNMNCKICLCNDQTIEDPLISPCNCKGYCGLIHMNCLRQWINNKVKKETVGMAVSYNFTKFECEICKGPFPKIIRTQADVEVQMMKIQKPQKPYIMLQSLDPTGSYANPHPNQTTTEKEKLLHVITTDQKNPIKIGRANECEIRLMDISVSRRHAEIRLADGNFYIKDTGAKFGTLVELVGLGNNSKQQIIINKKKPLKIQLSRTSYEFSVEDINEDVDTQ